MLERGSRRIGGDAERSEELRPRTSTNRVRTTVKKGHFTLNKIPSLF